MMMTGELWTSLSSTAAAIMFAWAMFQQYFPYDLREYLAKYGYQFLTFFYPYIQITFHEYTADRFKRSEVYSTIEAYLTSNSSQRAKRLKADAGENSRNLVLSMDDHEEVTDEFHGIKFWWSSNNNVSKTPSFSFYRASDDKRFYKLTFHKRYRDLVTASYLNHVMDEGKAVGVKNRQRKLLTNNKSETFSMYGYKKSVWSHVLFEHPATFQTLAMEPQKKKEIRDDLINFSKSKDYYKKIGKSWKRGYLLYGPPGTGKSSMIAAMANLLDYDIYDLELTAVKDNTELRKLLIETTSKSIIVIEDIDCSLDLTGQRKKEEEGKEKKEGEGDPAAAVKEEAEKGKDKESKVTLSGLLNFIDGLWSACGGERLIVFTTNYVEKLDPALIRRGRMDKHIELSYCSFEGFKVLAKNYLDLDSHPLFETIHGLIDETQITPADVAENLMPKSSRGNAKVDCLEALIRALQVAKEEARVKAEEAEALAAAATREQELPTSTNEAQEKKSLTKTEDAETGSTQLENNNTV